MSVLTQNTFGEDCSKKEGIFPNVFSFSLKRVKLAHLQTLKSAYSRHLLAAETTTVSLLLCRCFLPASTVSKSSKASSVCSIEISALVPTTTVTCSYISVCCWLMISFISGHFLMPIIRLCHLLAVKLIPIGSVVILITEHERVN